MSLSNRLKKIKSAGIYRYVWDKLVIPNEDRPTLRLLMGYSEKGPFNTPVYIRNIIEFELIFGKINRKLERKGIFFHRNAELALLAGPILALNLKPFTNESVDGVSFDMSNLIENKFNILKRNVLDLYNTNRFWSLDEDNLMNNKYINISETDMDSHTIFIRPYKPVKYRKLTINDYYSKTNLEIPEYLEILKYAKLDNFFIQIFIFKNKFTKELCLPGGVFDKYFNVINDNIYIKSGDEFLNLWGEPDDALEKLAENINSNFVGVYEGCTIPGFKNDNNKFESIDVILNSDFNNHHIMMKIDESIFENKSPKEILNILSSTTKIKKILPIKSFVGLHNKLVYSTDKIVLTYAEGITNCGKNYSAKALYLNGYLYNTIQYSMTPEKILSIIFNIFNLEKSLLEALTNNVDVEYHYLVDTFDSYVLLKCKKEFANIAKLKNNVISLINFPKIEEFKKNYNFINLITKKFDINMLLNSNTFTLPSENEGADRAAYFTLVGYTDGVMKEIIPSAAAVSNCFVRKYLNNNPFDVVAGKSGMLTVPGVISADYNFDENDRRVLEFIGVNPILFKENYGAYVYANRTAKLLPLTGTSFININELIIYILDEVENILYDYQWEFNNALVRSYIKANIDKLCENIKNNKGIRDFKVICDESNNTYESIDNETLIVDIHITPMYCTSKMVLRLKINKTRKSK